MGGLDRVFRGRRGGQERPLAAIIAGLWRNGEQGVWYDPSDLSMMFQGAAGTLPVYMPGSGQVNPPVGLLLDKRMGLSLMSPALTPDFSAGAGWTRSAAVTTSSGLSFTTSGAGGMYKTVNNYFTVGRLYDVSIAYTKSDAVTSFGLVNVDNGAAAAPVVASNIAAAGTLTARWFAVSSGGAYFRLGSACTVTITSIVVREVVGNHAYQATTTSRPTLSARYNLFTASDFPNGVSDATSRSGLVTASVLAGYAGALAIGHDGATTTFAYKIGAPASTTITLSVVVKMDDGFAPVFGASASASNSDFALVVRNSPINPTTYAVSILGGGYYRVSATRDSGAGSDSSGIVKYSTNSSRTFRVTAYDVRPTNDGVGLPPYQRVVDASTYDTVGFPLYLRFDGVDDWLQTGNVDFSGTDVVTMATAYRKLSDAAVGEIFALSGNPTASSGTFGFYTPESANGTAAAVFFARGASSIISGQRLGAAPISCVAGGWVSISMPYMRYRINQGSSLTSSAATGGGNFGNYPLYIGRRSGTSFPFNGRLYSLIIRGTATPDATIAQVERHLNQKARIY